MEPSTATGALQSAHRREPTQLLILATLGLVGVASILVPNLGLVSTALTERGIELLFWAVLIVGVNLFFHFENRWLQFTLDVPLLLAAGALYDPPVVAGLALVSEVDVREVARRVSMPRAIYNRTQITISVFVASTVFHIAGGLSEPWPRALGAMVLAWTTFYVLNAGFVTTVVSIREGVSLRSAIGSLLLGRPLQYILTYLGYGIFALVLALLFRDIGPWAVVLFLVPLLVAHEALVRAERLQSLTEILQDRERLLELLSERTAEERRDERLRIASDLHDGVLQDVTRILMQSRFAREQCSGEFPLAQDLRQLVDDSMHALESLRDVISDLRQSPLGRGGLVPTIEQLIRDLRLDWGKKIDFHRPVRALTDLSPDFQLIVYQVVREGLINALKHADAAIITVSLVPGERTLDVGIKDDGVGFDPGRVDTSRHFGLGLIQERVRMVGGDLRVRSNPGQGCELEVHLPAAHARPDDSSR